MPSPPSPGHPCLAPLLGDLLSCRLPAPDASLTNLSSTLVGPSRLPKALLLPHHTPAYFPAALSWGAHGPHAGGMHPPMRGSRGTLPSSGIFRSWHMASAPPVVGGNIWDSF